MDFLSDNSDFLIPNEKNIDYLYDYILGFIQGNNTQLRRKQKYHLVGGGALLP